MSDPITTFLSSQGIDLSEEDLKHYGVKGMKWGKKKASTENSSGGGGGSDDPLFDKTTVEERKKTMTVDGWTKTLEDSKVTIRKQGTVNKFIEKLFDHKVGVGNSDTVTRNKPPRSVIKQGTVNKFIQGCFDKLHKK